MAEYINPEVLLNDIAELHKKHGLSEDEEMEFSETDIRGLLMCIPTADVAEVRHGHWIDCEDEYSSYVRCSVCGDEYTNWEADCAYTDFCPGCGADMRGADNARTE